MSNPLFQNSRVALGFGAIVIAGGLVASTVFSGFSTSEEAPPQASDVASPDGSEAGAGEQSGSAGDGWSAGTGNGGSGWADGGSAADGWGSAADSTPMAPPGQDGDVSDSGDDAVFGDYAPGAQAQARPRRQNPPGVRSRAAPGAPEIRPPGGGSFGGELREVDG